MRVVCDNVPALLNGCDISMANHLIVIRDRLIELILLVDQRRSKWEHVLGITRGCHHCLLVCVHLRLRSNSVGHFISLTEVCGFQILSPVIAP